MRGLKDMSSLRELSKRAIETKSILHKAAIQTLRDYIKQTPEIDLMREIYKIEDKNQLRAIWEAGVSQTLQLAIINQLEKLG